MAYSYVQYVGNGTTVVFSVPFQYIAQAHVEVRVNNVLSSAYSWNSTNSILFSTAPAVGAVIDIRRKSSQGSRLVDFQDGSTLTQGVLDADSNQNFFMAQEAIDAVASNIALDTDGVFDAKSKRIKNVADPVNAQDAVTKTWAETAMDSQLHQATTQAATATSKAAEAATSASASASSASSASTSAATATTKATDASTSATNAANSATSALNSKNAAATSETNAAASAAASASSAGSASSSSSTATTKANEAAASATTASTKASDATASASQATSSASGAATSATNAASSASSASGSATSAASSASSASTSATNAASSATSASGSASTATTKAAEAANSATTATTQAGISTTKASEAAASAVSAANSAAAAATALDNFDDRYLGQKTADPTLDNDGMALLTGALYFNTTTGKMRVYTGSGWIDASSASVATLATFNYVATAGQTTFSGNDAAGVNLVYTVGAVIVTLNGIDQKNGVDYTATTGSSIVLTSAAAAGDELRVYAFGNFQVADTYSQAAADAKFVSRDASGNVGIGTSSPSQRLQVQSTASNTRTKIVSELSGSLYYSGLELSRSGVSGGALIETIRNASVGGVGFGFYTTADNAAEAAGNYTERMRIDPSGNLLFNSGYGSVATAYGCRAWVNFNGTGTVAIRASGNVSSITDNGVGLYRVNFSNAMPDANYCVSRSTDGSGSVWSGWGGDSYGGNQSTTSCGVGSGYVSTPADANYIHVAIFR